MENGENYRRDLSVLQSIRLHPMPKIKMNGI